MPQQLAIRSAWHHLHMRSCRVVTRLEEGGVFAAAAFSGLPLDFEVRCRRLTLARAGILPDSSRRTLVVCIAHAGCDNNQFYLYGGVRTSM